MGEESIAWLTRHFSNLNRYALDCLWRNHETPQLFACIDTVKRHRLHPRMSLVKSCDFLSGEVRYTFGIETVFTFRIINAGIELPDEVV